MPNAIPELRDRSIEKVILSALEAATAASFRADLFSQGGRHFLQYVPSVKPSQGEAQLYRQQAFWLQDMAWEKLHTGNWKDVDVAWRDAYTLACLLTIPADLLQPHPEGRQDAAVADALRTLDLAVMMGGPKFRRQADDLIALLSKFHQPFEEAGLEESSVHKKQRLQPPLGKAADYRTLPPGSFTAPEMRVAISEAPSLEAFWEQHMKPEKAVVIKGALDHWPARTKWQDFRYLLRVAGNRTVPVEVGSHYLAEGWGQQLMLLSAFVREHLVPEEEKLPTASERGGGQGAVAAAEAGGDAEPAAGNPREGCGRAYLAQHPLFNQIPELRADIVEPMYCCLGDGELQAINAWFGPSGTVTPLHFDPFHNLLAQVVGRKYVRLYLPAASASLAPFTEGQHTNSSQVDLDSPTREERLMLGELPFKECILEPGQMLYIPPRHWHYVRSLDISFSVTFWWH